MRLAIVWAIIGLMCPMLPSCASMSGSVSGTGDKITDWQISVAPSSSPDSPPVMQAKSVPTVMTTADSAGLGSNVEEVLQLSATESLQSFDVVLGTGDIVYCKVTSANGGARKSEVYLRRKNSSTPENLVSASQGVFYLDPTVSESSLYYVSTAYGGQTLMRVALGESTPYQLTERRGRVRSPRVQNGMIAYVDESSSPVTGDVSVISGHGGPRRVIGAGVQPTWTSDGEFLLYVDESSIYQVTADGTGRPKQLLPPDPSFEIKDPALSPNNRLLAFAGRQANSNGNYDIFVLEVGSSEQRHITTLGSLDDMPRWISDDTLLFRSTRGNRWGIWSVKLPPDGGEKGEAPK